MYLPLIAIDVKH